MKKLLKIQNMSAGYGRNIVLKNVNLEVNSKDFIGIIGPNGGGKTTLLKAILGILPKMDGNITFSPKIKRGKRHSIGYLPQINNIDNKFPISVHNVVLSGLMSGGRLLGGFSRAEKRRANELLAEMGIYDIRNSPIGKLSGGQVQRTLLCRALINSPRLLILDEPSTYVDSRFEHNLYEKLRTMNEKMAILLVSHDIGTISSHVKSIACVNKTLHYHPSNKITPEQLAEYECPIQIISHGDIPHTVLGEHR